MKAIDSIPECAKLPKSEVLMGMDNPSPETWHFSPNDSIRVVQRTLQIWWTKSRRTLVHLKILSIAMNVPLGFVRGAVEVMFPLLANAISFFVGFVMAAAVGLFTFYSNIFNEEIADFSASLLPREVVAPARAAFSAPTIETIFVTKNILLGEM